MTTQSMDIYALMQTGKPYKTFKKTILGKVYVTVLNTFSDQPEGKILQGRANTPDSLVDVWSEKEYLFFRRMNKRHLELGTLIEYERPEVVEEAKKIEQASDDELKAVIKQRFMALKNVVEKTESIPFLYRLLELARELEASEKIIAKIETRISELQGT